MPKFQKFTAADFGEELLLLRFLLDCSDQNAMCLPIAIFGLLDML
jgi:hypothetical protein